MGRKGEDRRYNLALRLLGFTCSLLCMISLALVFFSGLSFLSGFMLAASISGLVVPSVATGEGLVEMVLGVFELIFEGVATIVEFFAELFSSIFG